MSVVPDQGESTLPRRAAVTASPELPDGLRAGLAGRWQVPLLLISLVALGSALWRMRPSEPPPAPPSPLAFEALVSRVVAMKEAGQYGDAGTAAESLLARPMLTAEQRARLHRLTVDIIHAFESGNAVHGHGNCRRLLDHSDLSLLDGETFDARAHQVRAQAREWMGQFSEAVVEYGQAITKGIAEPWSVRQHVLQLRRLMNEFTPDQLQAELDVFLASPDVPRELQFWAAQNKIELFAAEDRHDLSEQFLAANRERFADSPWRLEYDYLRAAAAFYVGRDEEAEPILRALRDQLEQGESLYSQATQLLGSISQRRGAPEYALSLFNEVVTHAPPSPTRAAALLGRAECLCEIERYPEAMQSYTQLVRVATEDPVNARLDLQGVRESARIWYQRTYQEGRLEVALEFAKFAANLAPATDTRLRATYTEALAGLYEELGKSLRLGRGGSPEDLEAREKRAKDYLVHAGDEFLQLCKLLSGRPADVSNGLWRAASCFDLAGERVRMMEVLDTFVRECAEDMRVPEALLQLGRARQTIGELAAAVEYYQRNLIEYPRTPAALDSLVPLSDCFWELGQADKAEQMLLRIVTPRPGDNLALITPQAPEYQDALFRLGDLYIRSQEYEKAIARYEEALARYGADPRANVATFQLADAYRKSAVRIRADLEDRGNVMFKDTLRAEHQRRLQRAHEEFERYIGRCQHRPAAGLSDLETLCLKLSHLYSADCIYDLSLITGGGSAEPFARSLSIYEKVAWLYQQEPIAMNAYVQMINCYLRMGKVSPAWMTLQRARWALRNIADEAFAKYDPTQDRAFWEQYLTWLEKKPTFASMAMARAQ